MSGGIPVSSPIAVTDDYDAQARNSTAPCIGADEFSGIISDLTVEWGAYKEKHYKLSKHFDTIIYSCDVGITKPDRKIFYAFLKKANMKAEECIFIDDKKEFAEAAIRLGFKGISFESPEQCKKDLKKYIEF